MRQTWTVLLVLAAAGPAPAGVELDEAARFDFAGIKMALPKDAELVGTGDRFAVVQAVLREGDEPIMSVALTALPRNKDLKLAKFVDEVGTDLSMSLAIRNLKFRTSKRLRVGGVEGEVQVQSYSFRGVEKTALRLFFLRPAGGTDLQMAYLLTVEAQRAHGRRALPVLIAVADTIELFDPVSPAKVKVEQLGLPVVNRALGYSFRPPAWWKVLPSRRGNAVNIFQFDYRRNVQLPQGQFRVARDDASPEEYGARGLRALLERVEKAKQTYTIVRQGAVKMGGENAYEWVLRHGPADADPERINVLGERTACVNGLRYSLSLLYAGASDEVAVAALEKMAGGIELFKPETPTTAPASAPAATAPAAAAPATQPAVTAPTTVPE